MKIRFNFDEETYDYVEVLFLKEEDLPKDDENYQGVLEDVKTFVVNPVVQVMKTSYPENTYDVEEKENGYKILCSAKDGEVVLNNIYRTMYTLFQLLDADVMNSKLTKEEQEQKAQEIMVRIRELTNEEISEKLGLVKEEETEKN